MHRPDGARSNGNNPDEPPRLVGYLRSSPLMFILLMRREALPTPPPMPCLLEPLGTRLLFRDRFVMLSSGSRCDPLAPRDERRSAAFDSEPVFDLQNGTMAGMR